MVTCRALRKSAEIDCSPFLWLMTTNGADLTKDLTNRAIITRIRKRPEGFQFKNYPEGSLKEHVKAHQQFYLDCVFAVLREWLGHGCPRTNERRHDFQEWCGSLDWIVQSIFGLPPLLDGHRAEQTRTATPALQWLRQVTQAVKAAGRLDQDLKTADLLHVAEAADIELPGAGGGNENSCQRAGKLLARIFRDRGDRVTVDSLTLIHCSVEEARQGHGSEQVHLYKVVENTSVPSPSPPSPP